MTWRRRRRPRRATDRRATGWSPRRPAPPRCARTWRRRRHAPSHRSRGRRRSGPGGAARLPAPRGSVGRPARARLTLATTPGIRMLPARQRSDGPRATGSTRPVRRRRGSRPGHDGAGADLLARRQSATPVTRPSVVVIGDDLRARSGSRRPPRGRPQPAPRQRARAAARDDRLAGRAAIVAGGLHQQVSGRAGRPRPHRGVADAAPGDRGPDRVGLERFGDEVGDGHRQDPQDRPGVVRSRGRGTGVRSAGRPGRRPGRGASRRAASTP